MILKIVSSKGYTFIYNFYFMGLVLNILAKPVPLLGSPFYWLIIQALLQLLGMNFALRKAILGLGTKAIIHIGPNAY